MINKRFRIRIKLSYTITLADSALRLSAALAHVATTGAHGDVLQLLLQAHHRIIISVPVLVQEEYTIYVLMATTSRRWHNRAASHTTARARQQQPVLLLTHGLGQDGLAIAEHGAVAIILLKPEGVDIVRAGHLDWFYLFAGECGKIMKFATSSYEADRNARVCGAIWCYRDVLQSTMLAAPGCAGQGCAGLTSSQLPWVVLYKPLPCAPSHVLYVMTRC